MLTLFLRRVLRERGGVAGGELPEGAGGAAEQRGDVIGDPFGVAVGVRLNAWAFISATCPGTPARIIASLLSSKVSVSRAGLRAG
jgi:hypothetical protein